MISSFGIASRAMTQRPRCGSLTIRKWWPVVLHRSHPPFFFYSRQTNHRPTHATIHVRQQNRHVDVFVCLRIHTTQHRAQARSASAHMQHMYTRAHIVPYSHPFVIGMTRVLFQPPPHYHTTRKRHKHSRQVRAKQAVSPAAYSTSSSPRATMSAHGYRFHSPCITCDKHAHRAYMCSIHHTCASRAS